MFEKFTQDLINMPSNDKLTNHFSIEFYGIPKNVGNFLAKRVVRIDLPEIGFDTVQHNRPRNPINDVGRLTKGQLSIGFQLDDSCLSEQLLVVQMLRQAKVIGSSKVKQPKEVGVLEKFDVKVKFFAQNDHGEEKFSINYKSCMITTMSMPQYTTTTDDEPAEVTLTLDYEKTEFKILDQFIAI